MSFFGAGLDQAWQLIIHRDPYLMHVTWVTIKVATLPTLVAAIIGIPIGMVLGLGRFRGQGFWLALANAGLGLPPVVVGVVLTLLLFPRGPLGGLHLVFTLRGVYLAQAVLALPVLVALTSSAVRDVAPGLTDQARAFGAGRSQVAVLALREARVGIVAALLVAVGSGLSEVGAVVLVGGNIVGLDQTLASAALQRINAGDFTTGLAIGIVLLVLILIVSALFTTLQYYGRRPQRTRRSS